MVTFCEAIAREEGWLVPDSRCRRNNNPGNLDYEPWEQEFGARLEPGPDARFAVFPTAKAGFSATSALLIRNYAGLTVAAAITDWAPPVENDTAQYIRNICAWAELEPATILTVALLQPPEV